VTTLDDVFVADAVTHAYNLSESNWALERHARQATERNYSLERSFPPAYRRTEETFLSDWPTEATSNVLFRESPVDFAVFHPQSISVYEDGLTSLAKAREFGRRHPDRSGLLASVDLIGMDDPFAELTRQVEAFDPHGVKLYPSYWDDDGHHSFTMDDPELAFPLFEHAADLGLDVVAVHKALPLGAVPTGPYEVGDVSEAASSFPDLNFEIVHGGLTFAEEAGVQIGLHENVYVNLEITAVEAVLSPDRFVDTMADLCYMGGKDALEKVLWGSGAPHFHPRLLLEAFWEMDFPEMPSLGGPFTITEADKRKMLGENLARAHGFDVDDLQAGLPDDEYAVHGDLPEPYSTTDFEVVPT
jgi:hypothetical protein